jgi:hypothetical protein
METAQNDGHSANDRTACSSPAPDLPAPACLPAGRRAAAALPKSKCRNDFASESSNVTYIQ